MTVANRSTMKTFEVYFSRPSITSRLTFVLVRLCLTTMFIATIAKLRNRSEKSSAMAMTAVLNRFRFKNRLAVLMNIAPAST